MTNPELLPCPFCGGIPTTHVPRFEQTITICCTGCGAEMPSDETDEAAIAAWNRRAPGWQAMETAPKDGKWILAYRPGSQYRNKYLIIHWNKSFEEWSIQGSGVDGFTHWQPLPAAPESAE